MYNVSTELKNKLNSNSVTTTARLTFSNPQLVIDGNNLVSLKLKDCCYNEGRIIGTNIAKDVEVTIKNNNYDLQDKEFYLEIGILLDSGKYEYIPYGNFIIDTVEDTKSNNEYKITAMDYMIKLNENFVEFDAKEYPMTMKQFLQKFAKQYGIELATQTLPNENLQIPTIPYFENMSGRTVLKNIAEVFGRFAKFNRENKLEFVLSKTVNEQISRNNMNSNLEIDKQYGEVNVVSILLSDDVIGENVTLRDEESIALYGENIIKIVGNEFLNTQDMRSAAIQAIFNELKGFKYIPTSFTYMAKPYLDCGDTILVQDMETDEYHESIVLNHSIEIAALRKSKMENLALTKVQVQQQYIPELEKRMGRTEFNVNKVDKKITLVVEEQTTQSNRITNVEKETNTVASNLNTFINETYSNDISNLQNQIDGAIQFWNGELIPTLSNYPANEWTTEEQRNNHRADIYTVTKDIDGEMKQGKSYRFDKVGNNWQWVELTDNELSAVQALANSKAKVYVTTPTVPYNVGDLWLKDKELYECIKSKDASGSYSASDWSKATKYTDDTKANEVDKKLTTTNEKVASIEINLDSVTTRVSNAEKGVKNVEQAIDTEDNFIRQTQVQIESIDNILDDVEMYGKLEQDAKVSSNILKSFGAGEKDYFASLTNKYTSDTNYYKAEPLADNWIHIECNLTGSTSGRTYINHFISPNKIPKLKTSTTYTIIYEFRNVDITKMSVVLHTLNTQEISSKYFSSEEIINSNVMKNYNGKMYKLTKATSSEFSGSYVMRNFQTIDAGDKFSYDYRISVLEGDKLSQDYTYEKYANRPSPEEEAKITVIGDNVNLFDKDNAIDGKYIGSNGNIQTQDDAMKSDFIEVEINENYYISGRTTWSSVALYDSNKVFLERISTTKPTGILNITNSNCKYIILNCSLIDKDTLKFEKGIMPTGYTSYGCGGIDYKTVGNQEKDVVIELPQGEFMAKIGDYEDYIDNEGILHKCIGKVVLDGSEKISTNQSNDNYIRFTVLKQELDTLLSNVGYSNWFVVKKELKNSNGLSVYKDNPKVYIWIEKTIANDIETFKTWLSTHNTEVYYALAEPYNVELTAESRKKYLNLPTIEGINNISISASTSGTYKRNTEMNKVYAKQNYVDEKFAEQVITNDNITSRVSATETTISNQSSDISSLNESIGSVNSDIHNLQSNVETVKTQYTDLKQTVDGFNFTTTSEVQEKLSNGDLKVELVKTTIVTIDNNGVSVEKDDSQMKSLLDNEGLYVNKGRIDKQGNNTLKADINGVETENLYVRTYATLGNHRFEGYIDENGKKRTGLFYQGGVDE